MKAALSLLAVLAALSSAAAASHPFNASSVPPVLTTAVNQKSFPTFNVESRLEEQFISVQHCLPIQLTVKEATPAPSGGFPTYALFDVNSTSLQGSYTIHPFVQNKQLRLSLNGTVESRDLVNVTITIPPIWAHDLFNATVTGKGYLNVTLPNTSTGSFQLQLSGTGIANMTLKPSTQLSVNADTNASFVGLSDYDQVVLNWGSTGSGALGTANDLVVQKAGSGGVYVAAVNRSSTIAQSGKGVTAITSTDTASLVQSGPGAVFLGVATAASITYAGGKNATYIQGTGGLSGLEIANVQYTTTGNGTLVFSAANAYPAITVQGNELTSCLNISKWSNTACNETAVPGIPLRPKPAPSRPKCAGTWVLSDSDVCYVSPLQGYNCQLIAPANGGEKFALVVVLFLTAFILIWVNSI